MNLGFAPLRSARMEHSPTLPTTHAHCTNPQESLSESSLDDDAMMAVEEALAAAFRSRFASKHQNKQKKGQSGFRGHVTSQCSV